MSGAVVPYALSGNAGRVVALVLGIEKYRQQPNQIMPVEFAKRDAEEFAATIREVYGSRAEVVTVLDNDATLSAIDYELLQKINGLTANDLFIFYYAGHGFHSADGNRLTAWDTHPLHLENTTLHLRQKLTDRLTNSACVRALAFVDACATHLAPTVTGRAVMTPLSSAELEGYFGAATYRALFLSCSPGEQSYPSSELRHGIWTNFLLKALRGKDDAALAPGRLLTDVSLRDYLQRQVPHYITTQTNIRATQTPLAMVSASRTFVIREVPLPPLPVAAAGDLSVLKLVPKRVFLEGKDVARLSSLNGFHSRFNYEPYRVSPRETELVEQLLGPIVDAEIHVLYQKTKAAFNLKSTDVGHDSSGGIGHLDTPYFRFTIEGRQVGSRPAEYEVVKQLELRDVTRQQEMIIDEIFDQMFDEVVVQLDRGKLDYAELVVALENFAEAHGGAVEDNQSKKVVTYGVPAGPDLTIDVGKASLSISVNRRHSAAVLLEKARQFRFGANDPTKMLTQSPPAVITGR